MRVLLKLILDCDPDAAWRAIRSPAVFREVSSPLMEFSSLEGDGFPTIWEPGQHPVIVKGGGIVPLGKQIIRLSFDDSRRDGVRIMRDSGRGITGALSAASTWDHRMAISADPAGSGKTLYRDQLIVRAGVLTPFAWYSLWAFWQWRGIRLQQLAPTWRFDMAADVDEPSPGASDSASAADHGSGL